MPSPPSSSSGPAKQDAFLADTFLQAYEKLIRRLLSSEQHGVCSGRHWRDVLRYADLDGNDGGVMPASGSIDRWRDWMAHSLNEDICRSRKPHFEL